MREGYGTVEDAEAASEPTAGEMRTGELLEPSAIVGFAAPEQPIADATGQEPIAVEQDARDCAQPTSDDLTPIVGDRLSSTPTPPAYASEAEIRLDGRQSRRYRGRGRRAAGRCCHPRRQRGMRRATRSTAAWQEDSAISAADRAPIGDSPADAGQTATCRGGSHQPPRAAKEAKGRACDRRRHAGSLEPASGGKDRGVHPGAAYRSDHPGHGRPDRNGQRPVVPLDVADAVQSRWHRLAVAARSRWRGAIIGRRRGDRPIFRR